MRFLSTVFGKAIEAMAVLLLITLAVIVVLAVGFRYLLNDSLPWYDEVASVLLAWITYFGAALAALRRSHLGFSAALLAMTLKLRALLFALAEVIVYAVFISLAWAGWRVLDVMEGMTLEALPWVSFTFVQSIVPLGCVMFIIAQLLSTPQAWARLRAGRDVEAEEIESEIAKAQAELEREQRMRKP